MPDNAALTGRGLPLPAGNLVEVGLLHTLGPVKQSTPEIFWVQRAQFFVRERLQLAPPLSFGHSVENLPLDHAVGVRAAFSRNHNAIQAVRRGRRLRVRRLDHNAIRNPRLPQSGLNFCSGDHIIAIWVNVGGPGAGGVFQPGGRWACVGIGTELARDITVCAPRARSERSMSRNPSSESDS